MPSPGELTAAVSAGGRRNAGGTAVLGTAAADTPTPDVGVAGAVPDGNAARTRD